MSLGMFYIQFFRGPEAPMVPGTETEMAWAMAQRYLGRGVWRPEEQRPSATPMRSVGHSIRKGPLSC